MAAAQLFSVDVRDMLCAQALAVVSAAVGRLPEGAALDVWYNQDDVKQDLLVWARTQGHRAREPQPQHLTITRAPETTPAWPAA